MPKSRELSIALFIAMGWVWAGAAVGGGAALVFAIPARAQAQTRVPTRAPENDAYLRGQTLEQHDEYAGAARAYREALAQSPASVAALLGLERAYAELGLSDSLLPILDTAIALAPRETAFRTAQLRTLRTLGERDSVRAAFDRWRREVPHDPAPYRTYARMLIADGFTASADTVLREAQAEMGSGRGFAYEMAQLRAAMGLWQGAAHAWRQALVDNPYLHQAAVFSLAPTPSAARDAVRGALSTRPPGVTPRRVLATLEVLWGSPRAGWEALRALDADSSAVAAWSDFAERAEGARAWLVARDALLAVNAAAPSADVAARAASDALNGGDAAGAVELAERAEQSLDSASAARSVLPVHLRALAALGRPADGESLLAAFGEHIDSATRESYSRLIVWGWVRTGNLERAKALMADAGGGGGDGGDEEAEGWLALYQGDLAGARERLAPSQAARPELLTALALLERTSSDKSPEAGLAFLSLARGDTLAAAAAFEEAASALPEAGSLLLATAARLYAAGSSAPEAMAIWKSIVETTPEAPEAPEADLQWARALRHAGDTDGSVRRLEHLILTYPESAMVPQARREMELSRRTVPPPPSPTGADTSARHR